MSSLSVIFFFPPPPLSFMWFHIPVWISIGLHLKLAITHHTV